VVGNTHNNSLLKILEYNNITTVTESHFNASSATKIIIHGFGSSCDKIWPREMQLVLWTLTMYGLLSIPGWWANRYEYYTLSDTIFSWEIFLLLGIKFRVKFCLPALPVSEILVSLSPAPAQAQPLGQAKVATISAYFLFLLFHCPGISGQIVQNKS
jgi:hypothetical protein